MIRRMQGPGEVRAAIRRESGPARRPGSRRATCRPTSSRCRRPMRSTSCASASPTPARARCSRSASRAPEPVDSRPAPTCAPTSPATASGATARLADERADVRALWRDDLVAFLIGCSFTFERALLAAELPVRHVEQGVNVPMYRTAVACRPAGRFSGPLVVSMRPMTPPQAIRATEITPATRRSTARRCTSATRRSSGSPTSARPHYGDPVEVRDGEIPVFWACGVTPQAAAAASRPELMITHAPGHMFVTDVQEGCQARFCSETCKTGAGHVSCVRRARRCQARFLRERARAGGPVSPCRRGASAAGRRTRTRARRRRRAPRG